jgi:NAD+ synthase
VKEKKKNNTCAIRKIFFFGHRTLKILYSFLDSNKMQTEKVIEHITNWLKGYQQSSHSKGFVIGISGGIDSAVVSTLCARTGLPVLVIEMPIRQSSGEKQRSRAHLNWLASKYPNVTGAEVDLSEAFDTFEKTVTKSEINEINTYTEVALANTRSRLRMVRRFN